MEFTNGSKDDVFFLTHLRKHGTLFEGCFCGFPYFPFFDRWDSFVS